MRFYGDGWGVDTPVEERAAFGGVLAAFSSGCARSKMAQDKDPLSVYMAGHAQSPATRVFSAFRRCYRLLIIPEIPLSICRQAPLFQQVFRYL